MTIARSVKVLFVLIFASLMCTNICLGENETKPQLDAGQRYIELLRNEYGEAALGMRWGEINPEDANLKKKMAKFFGTESFSVIIYCDINMDGFKEAVAVRKYKNRNYHLTKAIIIQDNKAQEYPVLLKITLKEITTRYNEVILNQDDMVTAKWWTLIITEECGMGLNIEAVSDDIPLKWDKLRRKYFLNRPPV